MEKWKGVVFEDLFDIPLKNGLNKPSRVRGEGIPMVNMKEIFGFDFIDDKTPMELVPVSDKELSCTLKHGDLLFARQSLVLEGAGKISLFRGSQLTVFESHLIRCRLDFSVADSNYIYYFFKSNAGRSIMSAIVYQTAAAGIRGSDLKALEFSIPLLPEQKAIASVLSSLDDKIDLLHRQNKTLEQLAETLFRQWFIEEADESWEELKLSEIVNIGIGRTPPRKEFQWFSKSDNDVKWVSIRDMADGGVFMFNTAECLTKEAISKFNIPIIPSDQ